MLNSQVPELCVIAAGALDHPLPLNSSANKRPDACAKQPACDTTALPPKLLLDALPGPAWIVDCSRFRVLERNAPARAYSANSKFSSLFPARLDDDLLARLRSPEPQVGFHARLGEEPNPWLFSAALLAGARHWRLILAQPCAAFDVPTQLTFDELLDSAFEGFAILDARRKFVQINLRFQQMFGYSIEELRGKTPEILVPPGSGHEYQSSLEVLDRGGIFQLETRRLHRDGTLLEVEISCQPIASGRFRGGQVAMYRDLTEAKRHIRYHNLRLEATRILATEPTVEQAARWLLPAIAEALGWDGVRLWQVCQDGVECIHGHYTPAFSCCGNPQSVAARCTINAERVVRDGRAIWIDDVRPLDACPVRRDCKMRQGELAAFPIVDTQKQVVGVLELLASHKPLPDAEQRELIEGICAHLGQFITRCKAELALAENEAKFRTLAETAPTAIFIHDNGVILYANAAFESIFGYSRSELPATPVWDLFPAEDRAEIRDRAMRRARGEEFQKRGEARMVRKDGELRWIDYSAARVTLGNRPTLLCAAIDSTERRALEIQLRQTQKMEAVGRLAGGIAHDFNNLLMVIGCSSEAITLSGNLPEEARKGAEEIAHAVDRAAALTRQLLAFSRYRVMAPRIVDLNAVIGSTELILRRALGDDITLRFDLEPGLGPILADPSQIEQIVMNLAVNARDAMPNGGKLSIATSILHLDEAAPEAGCPPAGSYALLTVTDTGHGISQETQQHIFEPFFTTKHPGKGTGLGLATVYGIVKQSGGFLTVESQPQCGATFKVFLPIATASSAPEPVAKLPETATSVSGTILLVEDEPDVRAVLHGSLVKDGHTVLEAAGGAHALQVSAAYEGNIDLLVTDVVMPEMSGRELADQLVPIRPGLKVLYVSGYNEDTVLQKGVVEGKMDFLQKPFTPLLLSRKVRKILSH
jgi:PAS domain S-box-containing protein